MRFLCSAALRCAMFHSAMAAETPWPSRPVRLFLPFPPGGAVDANARALAKQMEPAIGQPIVIDNRGGANGIIAYDMVAKAVPDGHTLLHTSVSFIINAAAYRDLPFNVTDFVPITNVVMGQGALMVINPSIPATTIRDFVALAKSKPFAYGSPGIGNSMHLIAEGFNAAAGTNMTHVPYKGASPALTAVVGGEVQTVFVPPTVAIALVQAKKLRALGYTAMKRFDALPDVPTIREAGVPYSMNTGWHAWFAPAKTPPAVVNRIYEAIRAALPQPKLREFYVSAGYEPTGAPPAEFAKIFERDLKTWGDLARRAKIQQER